jgi:hypothetical protein
MRASIRISLVLIVLALFWKNRGFSSPNNVAMSKSPFMLAFVNSEVRSRRWEDALGRQIGFINSSVFRLSGQPDLVIIKYGVQSNNITYCLDFYAKFEPSTGGEDILLLLSHDSDAGQVIQTTSHKQTAGVKIDVLRQFSSIGSQNVARKYYSYEYTSNGLRRGVSDIWTTNIVKGAILDK